MSRIFSHGFLFLALVFLETSAHRLVTLPVPLPVTVTFLCVAALAQAQGEHTLRAFLPLLFTGALAAETESGMTAGAIFIFTVTFPLGLAVITKLRFPTITERGAVVLTALTVFLLRVALHGPFLLVTVGDLAATHFARLLLLRVILPALIAVPLAFLWWRVLVVSPLGQRVLASFYPRGVRYSRAGS